MSGVEARQTNIKPSKTFRRDRAVFRAYRAGASQRELMQRFSITRGEVGSILAHEIAIEARREFGVPRDLMILRAQRRKRWYAERAASMERQERAEMEHRRKWDDYYARAELAYVSVKEQIDLAAQAEASLSDIWERNHG